MKERERIVEWIVAPGVGKFFVFEARPIAEALEAYRAGEVRKAARLLSEAEAHIVHVRDSSALLEAVEEAAGLDGRFLFRGSLDGVFASDQVEAVDEAHLGILLEGEEDEEGDMPLSVRRIPPEPSEFYRNWGRGDEVFSFYAYQDLLAYLAEEPLETFPGLEGEEARPGG